MKHVFMGTPKVSIIVPVYNAGSYFSKLLDSLTGQTLKEIEIILVLDCPTDGSDRVAEEYAARDGRIVLVRNRENLHVGFSRNEGLKIARGEYIGFCDHDDWVEPEMFEKMYHQGKETGAEVVVADYSSWIPASNAKRPVHSRKPIGITDFTSPKKRGNFHPVLRAYLGPIIPTKIFRGPPHYFSG